MKSETYNKILKYIRETEKPVSPHELSVIFGRSRVTIHSVLRRLIKNGWLSKEGTSPKVYYKAVDPFTSENVTYETPFQNHNSLEGFLNWCKENGYHIPERVIEYKEIITKMNRI